MANASVPDSETWHLCRASPPGPTELQPQPIPKTLHFWQKPFYQFVLFLTLKQHFINISLRPKHSQQRKGPESPRLRATWNHGSDQTIKTQKCYEKVRTCVAMYISLCILCGCIYWYRFRLVKSVAANKFLNQAIDLYNGPPVKAPPPTKRWLWQS